MTKSNKKKQIKKSCINPVLAVTGAVIGTGVAVAGAMVMKDKKKRNKAKKVFTNVKNQAVNYLEKIEKKVKKDMAKTVKK